jgi:hypothetical protein
VVLMPQKGRDKGQNHGRAQNTPFRPWITVAMPR